MLGIVQTDRTSHSSSFPDYIFQVFHMPCRCAVFRCPHKIWVHENFTFVSSTSFPGLFPSQNSKGKALEEKWFAAQVWAVQAAVPQPYFLTARLPVAVSRNEPGLTPRKVSSQGILVPRGRAPFSQHQELRPLATPVAGSTILEIRILVPSAQL